jgi:hypothetical protein
VRFGISKVRHETGDSLFEINRVLGSAPHHANSMQTQFFRVPLFLMSPSADERWLPQAGAEECTETHAAPGARMLQV